MHRMTTTRHPLQLRYYHLLLFAQESDFWLLQATPTELKHVITHETWRTVYSNSITACIPMKYEYKQLWIFVSFFSFLLLQRCRGKTRIKTSSSKFVCSYNLMQQCYIFVEVYSAWMQLKKIRKTIVDSIEVLFNPTSVKEKRKKGRRYCFRVNEYHFQDLEGKKCLATKAVVMYSLIAHAVMHAYRTNNTYHMIQKLGT